MISSVTIHPFAWQDGSVHKTKTVIYLSLMSHCVRLHHYDTSPFPSPLLRPTTVLSR